MNPTSATTILALPHLVHPGASCHAEHSAKCSCGGKPKPNQTLMVFGDVELEMKRTCVPCWSGHGSEQNT